jgi:signal transduction histidine kinase
MRAGSHSSDSGASERRALQDFARALSVIVDAPQLHTVIAAQLRDVFDLERLAIVLRDQVTGGYQLAESRGLDEATGRLLKWNESDRLVRWLRVNEVPLVLADQPGVVDYLSSEERQKLEASGAQAAFPLVAMNRLTGFFLVGSDRTFDVPERDLLMQMAHQAALALENATLVSEQRARLRRLYRAERLATAGELAAGAAHEIRNPLTSIRSTIQHLHSSLPEGHAAREDAQGIMEEVDRINGILEALLSFARPSEAVFSLLHLDELVRQSLDLIAAQARSQGVEVAVELPADAIPLVADAGLVKQVLLNLMLNALQAMEAGGNLLVRAQSIPPRRGEPAESGGALFEVVDSGKGIPEEALERAFDPFFTTKPTGTGLGLSICYGIVERHNGDIEIKTGEGEGTTVRVRLAGSSK